MKNWYALLLGTLGIASGLCAEIDTSSLLVNTADLGDIEALRAYCQKKCLDDGDCVEKCMNLTLKNEIPT